MMNEVSTVESSHADEFAIHQRLNLLIVLLQIISFAAIVFATSRASYWWELAALAAAFAVVGNSIYSIIHEAEHGMLLYNRWANDGVGIVMSLLFPASFHLIRQGHLGHHRRNRSDDEAFDLYFDGDIPILKWLIFYGILTGLYWFVVVLSNFIVIFFAPLMRRRVFEFDRPSAAFMESLNPRYWPMIQLEGLAAIALHSVIIWSLSIPIWNYSFVYFGFGFTWSAMQYVHHYGTQRHVLRGARNLWLFGPIDVIWLHHNWHLAHHEHPTVPWVYLPLIGRESSDPRRGFLPFSYLHMWRGPRYTKERVDNKYAGKVIH